MSKNDRLPTTQEQIIRQSSLNRATDFVNALVVHDAKTEVQGKEGEYEGYACQDIGVLQSLIIGVAEHFESWVHRPVVTKVVEKRDYNQYKNVGTVPAATTPRPEVVAPVIEEKRTYKQYAAKPTTPSREEVTGLKDEPVKEEPKPKKTFKRV